MFSTPKYLNNTLSLIFPRCADIHRHANEYEDILRPKYNLPSVPSVPEDAPAEFPRIIIGSKHGFSQILISQISVSLQVTFTPDWQVDQKRCEEYVKEHVPLMFEMAKVSGSTTQLFSGFGIREELTSTHSDVGIIERLASLYDMKLGDPDLFDLAVRTSKVIDARYFCNASIQNFRRMAVPKIQDEILRVPSRIISERGLMIEVDVNDRYRYNESADGNTSVTDMEKLVILGFTETLALTRKVQGGTP